MKLLPNFDRITLFDVVKRLAGQAFYKQGLALLVLGALGCWPAMVLADGEEKVADKSDEFATSGTLRTEGASAKQLPTVVSGVFATQGDKKVFVTDSGVVLKAENVTDKIGSNAKSIRVDVTLKKVGGEATIEKTEAELPKKLAAAMASIPTEEGRALLNKAVEDLKQKAPQILSSSSPEERDEYSALIKQGEDAVLKAFMGLTEKQKDEKAVKMGAAFLAARRDYRNREKAFYGYDDQWTPQTYSTIFEWCNPIGQLSVKGKPIGTCFLVGRNLVLTCEHCVVDTGIKDDHRLTDLSVTFYKEGTPLQTLTYPVVGIPERGYAASFKPAPPNTEKLDFAFLELGKSSADKTSEEDGLKPVAVEEDSLLARDTAVYVVGYPQGGGKMVADNAHIFVPYEITEAALNAYRLELNGELAELKSAALKLADGPEKRNELSQCELLSTQLEDAFKASFKQAGGNWRFESAFMYPQTPAIAIDTETFHGNSGSPVFLRKTSKVIALFLRGYEDTDRAKKATWRQHEEAVPVSVIFQHWKRRDPNGLALYGIQPFATNTALTSNP